MVKTAFDLYSHLIAVQSKFTGEVIYSNTSIVDQQETGTSQIF